MPRERTLLLVDDDPFLRRATGRVLKREGYLVLEAEDGARALEVAAAHGASIDLLVTDVMMPKIGGRELAEKLVETYPGIGVVFISGYATPEVEAEILASGHRYLHKPFSSNELVELLRELSEAVPA